MLKGGVLANFAVASFGHPVRVISHGLKKMQYQPGLIEGCLAGTRLTWDQIEHPTDTTNKGLSLDPQAAPGRDPDGTRPRIRSARPVMQAAREANLLVAGSRGHGDVVGKLLGWVSEHCDQRPAARSSSFGAGYAEYPSW